VTTLLRTQQLEVENERLRKLLGVKERQQASGQVAQILYSARDPYARRVVIDKGQQDKVIAGQPVIDDARHRRSGDAGVPLRRRSHPDYRQGAGGAGADRAYRHALGGFRSRQRPARTAFLPANADVQNGDLLVTSGLDGIFLPGFPVAKVVHIERDTSYSFARSSAPVAGVENFSEVMVLDPRPAVALPEELAREAVGRDSQTRQSAGQAKKKRPKKD
jgi:rod shape-determining protein MreC